jgi:hypothetical protein
MNEPQYADVPADFPRTCLPGSLAGKMPKLALVEFEGKYYGPGDSPPERYARWQGCEDLARQFQKKCLETKAGKRAAMPEAEILQQYLDRLLKTNWGTEAEMRWVISRTAELLGWPRPASLPGA